MGLKEEIEDMKKEVKDIQEHSFAMELNVSEPTLDVMIKKLKKKIKKIL